MASNFNKTDKKQTYLHHQIEKYVKFVNQIIYDEDFLECMQKILPFDEIVNASMTTLPDKHMIRQMGVNVMRMDFEPALFSLGVFVTIDKGNDQMQEYTIYITACKTIAELQDYVKSPQFREQVTEQFCKSISDSKCNNCY